MGVSISPEEGSVLYRLLAESSTDVIVKTDCDGNIVHGVPTMSRLGLLPPAHAAARHLLDLVDPDFAESVGKAHRAAITGRRDSAWVEFPGRADGERGSQTKRWFAIQTRCIADGDDVVTGGISIVRSIEERRSYEDKLFAAVMTDPLTGLTNRSAFVTMLQHLAGAKRGPVRDAAGAPGYLAMFDLDHFKAINLRYGHAAGDEVLVAFADLMRALTRDQDIISRTGGESFGIIFPGVSQAAAERTVREIVETLAASSGAAGGGLTITVSAGLAAIGSSLDDAIRRAELALAVAKARGRNRLHVDHPAGAVQ